MNPANLFHSGAKTDQPGDGDEFDEAGFANAGADSGVSALQLSFAEKTGGWRSERGGKGFWDGARAQTARQLPEAAAAYRKATQLDPAYFEAYYNLGVVSAQSGTLAQALGAYETALVIQPDSHDARFNFALALKQANYPMDAAIELEKVVAKSPNDIYAHLCAGEYLRAAVAAVGEGARALPEGAGVEPEFPAGSGGA